MTNCHFTVCIFESGHDIKNLTTSSYSVPLETLNTKLEVIPPNDAEGDTFQVKTTLSRLIFPQGLAKILLGIPMDLVLNFLQRADRELSEMYTFTLSGALFFSYGNLF